MMSDEPTNIDINPFENCDSSYVFEQVRKRLSSSSSRSLWKPIESEMQRAGVGAADTYLRSIFIELTQEVHESIKRYRELLLSKEL